jgi:hypothetical protein
MPKRRPTTREKREAAENADYNAVLRIWDYVESTTDIEVAWRVASGPRGGKAGALRGHLASFLRGHIASGMTERESAAFDALVKRCNEADPQARAKLAAAIARSDGIVV